MSDKKILRLGALVIIVAVLLRLSVDYWQPVVNAAQQLHLSQVALFLQTGRIVRFSTPAEQSPETPTQAEPAIQADFSESDQSLIQLRTDSGQGADIPAALIQPLTWDLYNDQPTVLIIHSHGSESYTPTGEYTETANFRTLDTDYNVVSVGDLLAEELEKAGIRVIHDRTMYDIPSYNDAYVQAREGIQAHLSQTPSICLVLDLHRDAATDASGNPIHYTVATPEGDAAKMMLVLGTNHENWRTNLALATKLQVQLEKLCPGICRPTNLRAQRFNQDLCPNTVLVEMGATGNSHGEALVAARYLANAVISLAPGFTPS